MNFVVLILTHMNNVKTGPIYEANFMRIEEIQDLCAPKGKLFLIVGIINSFAKGIRRVCHCAASSIYFGEIPIVASPQAWTVFPVEMSLFPGFSFGPCASQLRCYIVHYVVNKLFAQLSQNVWFRILESRFHNTTRVLVRLAPRIFFQELPVSICFPRLSNYAARA